MKIWYDTEFIEDGSTIELISIGMVKENGGRLYLENKDCDLKRASPWVIHNVIPKLDRYCNPVSPVIVPKQEIRRQVIDFCGPSPEFWAYYAAYDWIVLCQLFGKMIDLPATWPMYCMDFKQLLVMLGNPHITKLSEDESHNALIDAVWLRHAWYETVENHSDSVLKY